MSFCALTLRSGVARVRERETYRGDEGGGSEAGEGSLASLLDLGDEGVSLGGAAHGGAVVRRRSERLGGRARMRLEVSVFAFVMLSVIPRDPETSDTSTTWRFTEEADCRVRTSR